MGVFEGLGGILGGVLGNNAAKMDRAHQKDMMSQAIQEYRKIGYPPDYAKELVLQEFQQAGLYTPELEEDLNSLVAESQVGQIQEDPALKEAQKSALSSMQQRAKVGLSAEDRAALNQVRQQVQQDSQAKQGQILQEMQARGQGGSGAELIAKLQAGQSGADRASSASDSLMAAAQEKALQALAQSGQMASQTRGQDFDIANTKASALDERNRFLAENSIARQGRNVGALNTAQQQNLANKQNTMNMNTAQANAEKQRQAEAQQRQYQDKLNYASGITGQQNAMANYYGNTANAKAGAQMNMAKGAGAGVDAGMSGSGKDGAGPSQFAGLASMFGGSDENMKEHIDYTDDDVQKWLDGLSAKVLRKKPNE